MLTVKDLMTPVPTTVTPDSTLRYVVQLMRAGGLRQLPVLEDGKLVGIITDRDVHLAVGFPMIGHKPAQFKLSLDQITAGSCMTPNPLTITPDVPAYRAAEILSLYKSGALVVEENETIVGIITVADFLKPAASAPFETVKYGF